MRNEDGEVLSHDANTLREIKTVVYPARLFVAVFLGESSPFPLPPSPFTLASLFALSREYMYILLRPWSGKEKPVSNGCALPRNQLVIQNTWLFRICSQPFIFPSFFNYLLSNGIFLRLITKHLISKEKFSFSHPMHSFGENITLFSCASLKLAEFLRRCFFGSPNEKGSVVSRCLFPKHLIKNRSYRHGSRLLVIRQNVYGYAARYSTFGKLYRTIEEYSNGSIFYS